MTQSKSIEVVVLAACLLVALGVGLYVLDPWAGPAIDDRGMVANTQAGPVEPVPSPVRGATGEPVLLALFVNVSGTDESMGPCRVIAELPSGEFTEAKALNSSRFAFEGKLPQGTRIFACVVSPRSANQRELPKALVSQCFEFKGPPPRSNWEIELRLQNTFSLTAKVVLADDQAGTPVEGARVGIEFKSQAEALGWTSFLRVIGVPLEEWLAPGSGQKPVVPLLRAGVAARLTAEKEALYGESLDFVVKLQETVTVVLQPQKSMVAIDFKDPEGKPVAQLPVGYSLYFGKDRGRMRSGSTQTTADGRATVSFNEPEAILEVRVISDDWYLPGGKAEFQATPGTHEVIVRKAVKIVLDVTYADGARYSGFLRLQSANSGSFRREYQRPGVLDEVVDRGPRSALKPVTSELYEIAGVPADEELTCDIPANRTGFGQLHAGIQVNQLVNGNTIALVIPKSTRKQPSAKFVFHGDFKALADAHVHLLQLPQGNCMVSLPLKIRKESGLLYPGDYKLILSGSNSGWESDTITLKADEERVIDLPITAPASVSVTLLSNTGAPLKGALLTRATGSLADFPVMPLANWSSVTDEQGKATLGGCPAGNVALSFEAEGFQGEVMTVTLVSGTTTDLGVIKLQPAAGQIHVRIKNYESLAGRQIFIDVETPYGGRRGPYKVTSGDFLLSGIPVGWIYSIAICPKNGRSHAIVNGLKLTAAQPLAEAEFDAATFNFDE